jgi:3-hydroxyisobutyrate dehydrogenase-like beta-hydroxyacid dehydrogenase
MTNAGFIGFGEAAFHIASGLREDGLQEIFAYDAMGEDPVMGPKIQQRLQTAGVRGAASLQELIRSSRFILCATSAKVALGIAEEAASHLTADHVYVDLNSGSPKLKQQISRIVEEAGARFVDGAVMESVPPYRHKVPILASGTGAADFRAAFESYGMNITVIEGQAGSSSAVKMVRSIFMKGFSALLLETLAAAYRSGIEKEIMASIGRSLTSRPFEEFANLLLTRTAIHAERRVTEMSEVLETLADLELDDTMSKATRSKLQSLVDLDLRGKFHGEPPAHYGDVIREMIK